MARTFDGVDDHVKVTIGACSASYGTFIAVIDTASAAANHDTLFGQVTSAEVEGLQVGLRPSGGAATYIGFWSDGAAVVYSSSVRYLDTDGWMLFVARKDTGTVAPRFSKYVYSTDTWTHETFASTLADGGAGGAGGFVYFGSSSVPNDRFQGDMAGLAWYGGVYLSDAQVESLAFSLNYWRSLAPSGLWLLDQAATTTNVIDETGGGANQTSIVGTAVGTSSVPVFSYGASMPWSRTPAAAPAAGPKLQVVTSNLRW